MIQRHLISYFQALSVPPQLSLEIHLRGFSADTVDHVLFLASGSEADVDCNDGGSTTLSYKKGLEYPPELSSLDCFKAGIEEVKGSAAASSIAADPTVRYDIRIAGCLVLLVRDQSCII